MQCNGKMILEMSGNDILEHTQEYAISAITYMELLGYKFESNEEELFIKKLLSYFIIVYIDEEIANKTIALRKINKIKLPDAIICASCIINKSRLYTNDIRLSNIKELNIKVISI